MKTGGSLDLVVLSSLYLLRFSFHWNAKSFLSIFINLKYTTFLPEISEKRKSATEQNKQNF